ncbi:unnamed protein product [[Candida] boidinii]|uniref:Unnamed protein product n=1 Tax=Candida boidinii TaxID=5477 RepID=A0A9W6T9H8_CANBO|nr:unnamed protein product [[Candida] boidinii]
MMTKEKKNGESTTDGEHDKKDKEGIRRNSNEERDHRKSSIISSSDDSVDEDNEYKRNLFSLEEVSMGSKRSMHDTTNKHDIKKRKLDSSKKKDKKNKKKNKKRHNHGKQRNDSSFNLIEKFRSFNLEGGDAVDPLLGVGQTLFPIIGKVATLICKVRKEKKNSLMIVSQAVELKSELEKWTSSSTISLLNKNSIEDPLFDLASAIATAEAYRISTLLYLHQAVPEIPSLSSHQLAEKVLMLLASIPKSSRTCIAHIFPLLVASCEALPGDEREWVRNRWELLSKKMWIGNIDRALEVVKEVWSRKDLVRKRNQAKRRNSMNFKKNKSQRKRSLQKNEEDEVEEEDSDGNSGIVKLANQISGYINGGDMNDEIEEEEDRIKSWTHWTTVMKDWGWEVLLA